MKKQLDKLFRPFSRLYDLEYAFVPFGISRTVLRNNGVGVVGWAHYRIFGIRIAKVQETKPWE